MTIHNNVIQIGGGSLGGLTLDGINSLATHVGSTYEAPAHFRRDAEARVAAELDVSLQRAGLSGRVNLDAAERYGFRMDAANPSAGVFGARALEALLSRTTERKSPLSSERIFGTDSTIGAGAESYKAIRDYAFGQAGWYKGRGSDIPQVALSANETTAPIRTAVVSMSMTIQQLAAASFAGFDQQAREMNQMRRAIDELGNKVAWNGDTDVGLHGALNFPWTPKYVSTVSFSNANIVANPDDIIAELNFIVQNAGNDSSGAFEVTDLAMPDQLYNKLASTRITGRDKSILTWFIENNGVINSLANIHKAGELKDAGGAGIDCIYAFNKDPMSGRIIKPQGFTTLPPQVNGLSITIIGYARFGGFYAENAGDDLVAFVTR